MKDELGLDAELKVGEPGSYRVVVDGKTVAEKKSLWGFPSEKEVVDAVAKALPKG